MEEEELQKEKITEEPANLTPKNSVTVQDTTPTCNCCCNAQYGYREGCNDIPYPDGAHPIGDTSTCVRVYSTNKKIGLKNKSTQTVVVGSSEDAIHWYNSTLPANAMVTLTYINRLYVKKVSGVGLMQFVNIEDNKFNIDGNVGYLYRTDLGEILLTSMFENCTFINQDFGKIHCRGFRPLNLNSIFRLAKHYYNNILDSIIVPVGLLVGNPIQCKNSFEGCYIRYKSYYLNQSNKVNELFFAGIKNMEEVFKNAFFDGYAFTITLHENQHAQLYAAFMGAKQVNIIVIEGTNLPGALGEPGAATFDSCFKNANIKNIKIDLDTYTPELALEQFENWMEGVPAGGRFYKKTSANWTEGPDGVPPGWEIINY